MPFCVSVHPDEKIISLSSKPGVGVVVDVGAQLSQGVGICVGVDVTDGRVGVAVAGGSSVGNGVIAGAGGADVDVPLSIHAMPTLNGRTTTISNINR